MAFNNRIGYNNLQSVIGSRRTLKQEGEVAAMKNETLAGVYPPLPTPFNANGDLDQGALRDNLAHLSTTGLRGFVILGSNGE